MIKIGLLIIVNSVFCSSVLAANLLSSENFFLPPLTDNQEVLIRTFELEPGETSAPHRHNAHNYIYILEGSIIMQAEGEEAVTIEQGDVFYENPENIYVRSDNASSSETAKFLLYMIRSIGEPTTAQVSR